VSKSRLDELMGYDYMEVPHHHFFAKLSDPDYEVPPRGLDTKRILAKDGIRGYRMGFFIHHYSSHGFTNRRDPMEGAQLSELVENLDKTRGSLFTAAMVCLAAQDMEARGKVSMTDLGSSIEEIWAMYPFPYESRDKAFDSMSAYVVLGLNNHQLDICRAIGVGTGLSSPGRWEGGWEMFSNWLNKRLNKRLLVLAEEIGDKSVRDLTEDEQGVLDVIAGKKKLFTMKNLRFCDLF
jgi:hypothetical protein